jgi:hypothetical protein
VELKYKGETVQGSNVVDLVNDVSINIPWKIYQGRQSSCPLVAKSKALPGSLTDLSA